MGRNAVKKSQETAVQGRRGDEDSDKPAIKGGALGVVDSRAEVRVGALPNNVVGSAVRAEREPVPPERRFLVKYAPPQGVMYDNFRVHMRPGKVVTDQTYNLGLLTRQGVVLEEIDPPAPPKVEEPAAEVRPSRGRPVVADGMDPVDEDEEPALPAGPTAAE